MKAETRAFYEAAVVQTVIRIAQSLDEALDLAALAQQAALSPFHFHRVFRGMVGETPLELHRRLRLERAASQLRSSEVAITTIAFDAGYETHEAFTRTFHQAYGSSPTAFRKAAIARPIDRAGDCARPRQIELAAPSGVHFREAAIGDQRIQFVTGETMLNVTVETMPELRVATVHHVGPYPQISEAFARLGEIAGPAGLYQLPNTAMIAVYHDDPETTPAAELQSDAGLTIPFGAPLPSGLGELRLAAGRYARTTHVGPYTQLGDVWSRLMGEWLPNSGHRVGAGASYELYRNNPTNARPDELRTELYLLLA